ncbi:MAG: class I SAM-dependent methyltransferase [Flavobacteriales bacterium]|nr:class I SAM-dependent methyltransferase [Flavobacteriales bacterium]
MEIKNHWENVYATKTPEQVSWTQATPQTSLDLIATFQLPKSANIIDVGGGDSHLVDFLLELGYQNITVLDVSGKALERAQKRLGEKAKNVEWIECNILDFTPTKQYDLWHDRAAFHFLTSVEDIEKYVDTVSNFVCNGLCIATFSTEGPLKCSGLSISQYDEKKLCELFDNCFKKVACHTENHTTPFDTKQNFLFCTFQKKIVKTEST